MAQISGRTNLIVALVVASSAAALTIALEHHDVGFAVSLLVPGLIASMAIAGNVHAFPLGVAAIVNFVFYFLLCWTAGALIRKLLRRRNEA